MSLETDSRANALFEFCAPRRPATRAPGPPALVGVAGGSPTYTRRSAEPMTTRIIGEQARRRASRGNGGA